MGWALAALLAGVVYLLIGRLFALPARNAQAWRLAAWAVSGVVFAAHIAVEHFRRRSPPRVTAWRAALGAAIGAFGLAVAGMAHALSTFGAIRPVWLLALVLWPLITAVPAFLVALLTATVLARLPLEPPQE